MGATLLSCLTLLCFGTVVTWAFSLGPPVQNDGVCVEMNPSSGHSADAQTSAAPYALAVSSSCYRPGQELTVTANATSAKQFKGIFIQARKQSGTDTEISVGEFRVTDEVLSALTCNNKPKSAAAHKKKEETSERIFYWTAPENLTEDVQFKATIVAMQFEYWMFVTSDSVKFDANCGDAVPTNGAPPRGTVMALALPAMIIAFFVLLD